MDTLRAKPSPSGRTVPSLTSRRMNSPSFSLAATGLTSTPLSHSRSRLRLTVSHMAISRLSVDVVTLTGPAAAWLAPGNSASARAAAANAPVFLSNAI